MKLLKLVLAAAALTFSSISHATGGNDYGVMGSGDYGVMGSGDYGLLR